LLTSVLAVASYSERHSISAKEKEQRDVFINIIAIFAA